MFPSLVTKNQQGEEFNELIIDGSNQIWCNFTVDSTNANGLGISALNTTASQANYIKHVFMHTSQTPGTGNPNPLAGIIVVQFGQPYASFINMRAGIRTPLSGTPVNISSGLSVGTTYVITAVGTSVAANWQAVGLPTNIAPAVGVAFVATSASAGTGTGVVQVLASGGSGINHFELAGDPNVSCNVSSGGAQLILACYKAGSAAPTLTMASYTPAGTNNSATPPIFSGTPAVLTGTITAPVTTDVLAAPADGTIIDLSFNMVLNAAPLI